MKTLKELFATLTEINENSKDSLDRVENAEREIMESWLYTSLVH